MKKYILIFIWFVLIFTFISCNKTEVEEELKVDRSLEWELTEEDIKTLEDSGDEEFQRDYMDEYIKAVEENKIKEDYDLAVEIDDSKDLKKASKWWKFSCNMIKEGSTCIEYYWDFWQESQVKMGCDGIFSNDPCPADMIWWCNTWVWTKADMVSWMYLRGWWEMTEQSIKYAKWACNSTIASNWIDK